VENHYITEQTTSVEEYSKSLEYLIPGSTVRSKVLSNKFRSFGEGLVSEGFFLGNNITEYLAEIEIQNSNSCIFSIPLAGHYSTHLSHKHFKVCTPESGNIFLCTDNLKYNSITEEVNDLIVIIDYDQLAPLLEKNYNIQNKLSGGFSLKKRNGKLQLIYSLIEDNLQVLSLSPYFQSSLLFKSSVKELSKLLLSEIIADCLNIEFKLQDSPDSAIVRNAEELMDAHPEKYFSVLEIADSVYTSPRNLQLSFKKYREKTPMQFLKERKLHKARLLLLNTNGDSTIKEIAHDSGFSNMSSFSKYYREMFGELPSETLQKVKQNSLH